MDYQVFKERIYEEIKKALPDQLRDAKVEVTTIPQQNHSNHETIAIIAGEGASAPRVYLEYCHASYESGTRMETIVERIIEITQSKDTELLLSLASGLSDYNQAKEQLVVQLVDKYENQEFLNSIPHREVEHTNLAAIIKARIDYNGDRMGNVVILDETLKMWGISIEEVYEKAVSNMLEKHPVTIQTIDGVILDFMGLDLNISEPDDNPFQEEAVYVITNESIYLGASALADPDTLRQIADRLECSFYILPSSIHELILVPDIGNRDSAELQAMVIDMNHTQVTPNERLSNCIYRYDQKEHSLSMVGSREQTEELVKQYLEQSGKDSQDLDDLLER